MSTELAISSRSFFYCVNQSQFSSFLVWYWLTQFSDPTYPWPGKDPKSCGAMIPLLNFFNYFICCEMIVFILIILVGIILSFSLLLAIFLCCNSYSCHNRHQNPLTREDWFSSRRRLIFSFQDFYLETREESFNVQMMEHQPIFEGENQPGSSVAQLSNFERSPNPLLLNPSSGKVKFSKDRLSVSQDYWK